jgi:hypothetical protein
VVRALEQKADLVGSAGPKLTGPLELPATAATNQSASFKEPRVPGNFKNSVATSSTYEASRRPPSCDAERAGEGPCSVCSLLRLRADSASVRGGGNDLEHAGR